MFTIFKIKLHHGFPLKLTKSIAVDDWFSRPLSVLLIKKKELCTFWLTWNDLYLHLSFYFGNADRKRYELGTVFPKAMEESAFAGDF